MPNAISPHEALQIAVKIAGSQSAFARLCGVGQPAVWKWLNSSKQLPPRHALAVEAATGISRSFLCPDIYPSSLSSETNGVDHSAANLVANQAARVVCDQAVKAQRKDVV